MSHTFPRLDQETPEGNGSEATSNGLERAAHIRYLTDAEALPPGGARTRAQQRARGAHHQWRRGHNANLGTKVLDKGTPTGDSLYLRPSRIPDGHTLRR